MATINDLQQSYQNQNVREFLKLIADAEGVKYGYNTLFGNSYLPSLASHPNQLVPFTQKDGTINYSSAAGAYQFLFDTWERLKRKFGFNDFGGVNQDLGAIALIAEKGALGDVEKGDFKTAINKLGGVWASLPSSKYKDTQPSKTWGQIGMGETGVKKWMLDLPGIKILTGAAGAINEVKTNEGGVLAGAGEVIKGYTPDYVGEAGNFALRAVVIVSAVALVILGFYFMFKQEINSTIEAVT